MKNFIFAVLLLASFSVNAAIFQQSFSTDDTSVTTRQGCNSGAELCRNSISSGENYNYTAYMEYSLLLDYEKNKLFKVGAIGSGVSGLKMFIDGIEFSSYLYEDLLLTDKMIFLTPGIHTIAFSAFVTDSDAYINSSFHRMDNHYVPLPPALIMFAPALIGLVAYRRNKSKLI